MVTRAQLEFAERVKTEVARGILEVLQRQWQEELRPCLLCGRPTSNRYAWDETPTPLPLCGQLCAMLCTVQRNASSEKVPA